jgi:N-hydroxyarylamine O-acetyltransferase
LYAQQPRLLNSYADYAEMCHYHQTSPHSHFTSARICSRATPQGRITLSERRLLTTSEKGEREERTLTSEEEYADLLREHFGTVTIPRIFSTQDWD